MKTAHETTTADSSAGFRWIDLSTRLKPPASGLDPLPLLDLLTIALFFSLLFSRMVMTPGVRLELPETELRMPQTSTAVAVLTVQSEGMLLFDGGVYQIDSIQSAFKECVSQNQGESIVLLLKAGERLPMATLLNISAKAQDAGFTQIHLAAKRQESKTEALPTVPPDNAGEYSFPNPNQ
jgi:biopolymer transport protein ExbD